MFYDATLYMLNSKFVTLSFSIPIYNSLLKHLEKLVDVNDITPSKYALLY